MGDPIREIGRRAGVAGAAGAFNLASMMRAAMAAEEQAMAERAMAAPAVVWLTEYLILAPLWAPAAWSWHGDDEDLATMRPAFRWAVVRVDRRSDDEYWTSAETLSAHLTAWGARAAAIRAAGADNG